MRTPHSVDRRLGETVGCRLKRIPCPSGGLTPDGLLGFGSFGMHFLSIVISCLKSAVPHNRRKSNYPPNVLRPKRVLFPVRHSYKSEMRGPLKTHKSRNITSLCSHIAVKGSTGA
ncbi:hypothetical protein CDAR_616091 [Caerostris darwini]|uniref:Uncharacterized protein n=1 Tax=Caerostris darwini TaxID=1538125 RepID=A0AAV4RUG8_9ARAC|nr:hypothetical protein CDAR_616091 [Caerostris darwini]